ncbi:regulatory protein RecX [Sediminibacterium sp. TEGAF015]|uniref:regulatory protein RecX n=1 Tax=Sediminibacterium sp. TEGAF015 TaxID=575378 RepID=UPI0021FE45D5|nr:regulatory protein RecX [Sediminibacterium sp. TEGAF015]BDQ12844.1 regulatory protein RecX [Sediminibacterium sp. TEGAF015]
MFSTDPNSTIEKAYMKLKHYCGYQDRCHQEVKEKLYSLKLNKATVEQLLSRLIEEDYLNEERYAKAFVGGHFRQKQWGKVKIAYGLKQKRVSEYNIRKAMNEIPDEEYHALAEKLVKAKWNSLKKDQYIHRVVKTKAFLQQRGFEPALVQSIIQQIRDTL